MNLKTIFFSAILLFSGGLSWFFVTKQTGTTLPIEFSIFYRNIGSSLFLFIGLSLLGKYRIFKINKEEFYLILKVSILYYFFYFMASYYGSSFLIAGLVAVISSTKTIFVEFIDAIIQKRYPSKKILLAAILGSIGVFFMSKGNMTILDTSLDKIMLGLSIAFIAPISNACSYIIINNSEAKKNLSNFTLAAYGSLIGSLIILLIGLCKYKSIYPMPLNIDYLISWGYLAFFATGLITVIAYYLIEYIGPSKTTMMSLAHSPVALTLDAIFNNNIPNNHVIFGIILCVCALYLGLTTKKIN